MNNRLLSALLALCMVLTLFPAAAFASTDDAGGIYPLNPAAQGTSPDEENDSDSAEPSDPSDKTYADISTEEELLSAVNDINSNGTGSTYEIVLDKEIPLTQSLAVNDGVSVTIRPKKAPADQPNQGFPAGKSLFVVDASTLTLKNITLQGSTDFTGEALLSVKNGASVTLTDCKLDGCNAQAYLLRANDSTLTLENTTLLGPLYFDLSSGSGEDAALLYAISCANVTLTNCTLDGQSVDSNGNHSGSGHGTGLRLKDSTANMHSSKIQNCYAANLDGAGARLEGSSTLTMDAGSEINNCVRPANSGGGVYVGSSSALYLNGGTISKCHAASNGGGVCLGSNSNAGLIMNGGIISDCTAGSQGGGVYVSSSSTVEMLNSSKIENCSATKDGGGVSLSGRNAKLILNSSSISGCQASGNGGSTYLGGNSATLIMNGSSSIASCSAANGGGAYLNGKSATLAMNSSTIDHCNASTSGGGVYLFGERSGVTMENASSISYCKTTGSSGGGGLYLNGSNTKLDMDNSSIANCDAASAGGVYLFGQDSSVSMENASSISYCRTTGSSGGGAFLTGQYAILTMQSGSTISNCEAVKNSGGVYISGNDAKLIMNSSSIASCNADNAGGVGLAGPRAELKMENGSEITDCMASNSGGGVYLYSPSSWVTYANKLTLKNSSIKNCHASDGGGVLLDAAESQLIADNGIITGCTATADGGGVYFYGAGSVLYRTVQAKGAAILEVTGCTAQNGGGIFVDTFAGRTCSLDFSDSTICNNTAGISGHDFYLGKANYDVTLPVLADKTLIHNKDNQKIDGWYTDAADARHDPAVEAEPVSKNQSILRLTDAAYALVACSSQYNNNTYNIRFAGNETAHCRSFIDETFIHTTTTASPEDKVYLKYVDPLAEGARLSWSAAADNGTDVTVIRVNDASAYIVMPQSDVTVTPAMEYEILIDGGIAYDDNGNEIRYAKPGDTFHIKYTGTGTFLTWTWTDGKRPNDSTEEEDKKAENATYTMPSHAVAARANADHAIRYNITVLLPDDMTEDPVIVTASDGSVIRSSEAGHLVRLAFNKSLLPEGMAFGSWSASSDIGDLALTEPSSTEEAAFIMPAGDVTVTFTLTAIPPDMPSDGGSGDSGAGAVIAGAVIGAAGYLAGTHVWLNHLYGFIPENRIQLALALWNRADCPAPESTELYPDIDDDDDDAQAAARWCVEQGLMKDYHKTDKDGNEEVTFKPYRYVFRPQAIKAWYDLEKLLSEQQ